MTTYFSNRTLTLLRKGEITRGLFIVSASRLVAEVCATMPLDWLVLDMEASPTDRTDAVDFLTALKGEQPTPFIRVARNEHSVIEQVLDLGAQGIIVPKVHTVVDARRAVEACRFPPSGQRGLNPVRASRYFDDVPGYLKSANQEIALFVQIESEEALSNVESIAKVEGIDGLFVGCGDLAMSLGCLDDMEGDVLNRATRKVYEACRAAGCVAGIFAYTNELCKSYIDMGYTFVAIGNDVKALRSGLNRLILDTEPENR